MVSISIGAEGLLCEYGNNILIADSPAAFAGCVLQLLRDRERGKQLADHAYRTLLTHYEAGSVKKKVLSLV
ncbi:hypothetical protein [Paenibacillus sp. FSL R7-0331]|uniref:hypothetical protein n=1 Tax=Paenibacillus sp. FSL R7-0331 TaxID=1536773 RepID=UPI000A6403A3|nr:hypothetical protein [Paenibacillus sp. FSL R7-0331]